MTTRRLRILTRDEIKVLPRPNYLIHRIIPEKGLCYLVAPPSCKKTFVAVEAAACVASGHAFFGTPTKQGNVIYLAAEGMSGLNKRFRAWEKARRCLIPDHALSVIPEALPLSNPKVLSALVGELREHSAKVSGVSLLIIDTLNRTLEGDENSARDMGMFVKACSILIEELQTSILILHHPSKLGNGGARGHSSLHGAADLGFEIKNGKRENLSLAFEIKPPKDDDLHPPIHLKTTVIDLSSEFGVDDVGAPVTSLVLDVNNSIVTAPKNLPKHPSMAEQVGATIMTTLRNSCLDRGAIVQTVLTSDVVTSERSIDRVLKDLVKSGLVVSPEYGKYELSDDHSSYEFKDEETFKFEPD